MYVLGVENENATLTANGVGLTDTFPTQVVAGDANAANTPAGTVVIPDSVAFQVGALPNTTFNTTIVTDLNAVSFVACSTPTADPDFTGAAPGTGLAGDVGNCAAGETAYIAYFVTLQ